MKKLIFGLFMSIIMSLSFNVEVSATAEGYIMKDERCDAKSIQKRCRPVDGEECDVSAQTSCGDILPE
jgi:hypothetical protein